MSKLLKYVEQELRMAQRSKRIAEKACAKSPADYWSGNIIALRNVKRFIKAETLSRASKVTI